MEAGLKFSFFYKELYIHKAHFCTCSIQMLILHCLVLISFHTYPSHTEDFRLWSLKKETKNQIKIPQMHVCM